MNRNLGPQFQGRPRIWTRWPGRSSFEVPPAFDVLKEAMQEKKLSVPNYGTTVHDPEGGFHEVDVSMEHPENVRQSKTHGYYVYYYHEGDNPAIEGTERRDMREFPAHPRVIHGKTTYQGDDPEEAARAAVDLMGRIHRHVRRR